MEKTQLKRKKRLRRRYRARKTISGTPTRPRLVVSRTLRHIEVQIVDDIAGHSLVGMSTRSKTFDISGKRVDQGRDLGKQIAAKARDKGIEQVVFDRAGLLYHGIVKAVAEGAREGGLQF
jgi:large subunit ribosomal protein L18